MTKQTTQGMIDGHHFELEVEGPEALMAQIEGALAELKDESEWDTQEILKRGFTGSQSHSIVWVPHE